MEYSLLNELLGLIACLPEAKEVKGDQTAEDLFEAWDKIEKKIYWDERDIPLVAGVIVMDEEDKD